MRDMSDMMEDALSEDTMMDCGADDGGLEDIVDLATSLTDSSSSIRDAAKRLLTLLVMDEDNDEDFLSSEDEGVEVDIDELEDNEEETENTKLLHQLAASLAQELKYSQKQSSFSSSRVAAHQGQNSVHGMEMLQDNTNYLGRRCLHDQMDYPKMSVRHDDLDDFFDTLDKQNANFTKCTSFSNFRHRQESPSRSFESLSLDRRLWTDDPGDTQPDKPFGGQQGRDTGFWAAGWDACATEALRYLVEDEGLPFHHPTIVAMKNHLDLQRERALIQYTGYTECKSQDVSLVVD